MATYQQFFSDVLTGLGLPVTQGNLDALADVAIYEGINNRYNPLNSVVQSGNSSAFNSAGVQDYGSYANGVAGTISLLEGSHWAGVRQALDSGSYSGVTDAFESAYTWAKYTPPDQSRGQALLGQDLGAGSPSNTGVQTAISVDTSNANQNGDTTVNNAAFTAQNTGVPNIDPINPFGSLLGVDPLQYLAKVGGNIKDDKDAITALTNVVGYIAQAFKEFLWLFQPGHFIKFVLYMGGAGMVIAGIYLLVKGSSEGQPA